MTTTDPIRQVSVVGALVRTARPIGVPVVLGKFWSDIPDLR